MGGYVKKGPKAKPKKTRKGKFATLPGSFIKRGHAARARRTILPI